MTHLAVGRGGASRVMSDEEARHDLANDRAPGLKRILQIGTSDSGGGAAAVADNLAAGYRRRGIRVRYAVGRKAGDDPDTFLLPDDTRPFYRFTGYARAQSWLRQRAGRHPNRGWGLLSRSLRSLAHPGSARRRATGLEDFDFPGTYGLLQQPSGLPDVVHAHNLHGGFFDLRALAWLSHRVPVALTLHDMWLMTGHCAHAITCEKWETGCGACPDLSLYPPIPRDATDVNWDRKRAVFERSRLYVAAPSQWLLDRVDRSMLTPGLRHGVVIPNGVDLSVFKPARRDDARTILGLPVSVPIVLLTVVSRGSMWKDDRTVRAALERVAAGMTGRPVLYVALGRDTAWTTSAGVRVKSVPYEPSPTMVARYYQAADVYVHSARADTFPSAVLEALACGTPVVASAVGGIPEQIIPFDISNAGHGAAGHIGNETGILVPPSQPAEMARALLHLLTDGETRERLGHNATRDVRRRFDLETQVDAYLSWFCHVIEDWQAITSRAVGRAKE